MTDRSLASALSLALVLLAACGDSAPPAVPPTPVSIGPVLQGPVPYEIAATGTIEPLQTVAVAPQVSGQIVRVAFHEGDAVEKGQVLFEIDPRPFRAALQQAEANLAGAKARAEQASSQARRYTTLAQQEYVTTQQSDQATADALAASATLAASEAAVEQARLNLQYATIRAPISGRTGSLRIRAGNLVRAADPTPMVTINQIRPILARFAVPAGNLAEIQRRLSRQLPVRVEPTAGGDASMGTLDFIDNAVDTTTGTILLKATFPNSDGLLWPGEFVNVRLRLYVQDSALTVPASAVVAGQAGTFVFKVQPDSLAISVPVTVQRTNDSLAVITANLAPGDQVVTDGQIRLRDSARVQIRKPVAAPAAGEGS
jgi:multidrug efflux system membrane fusion protein